ncbi:MAG: DNA internalization-related competence protein ComEC/Rec2 [Pseudomonadales bacterium]
MPYMQRVVLGFCGGAMLLGLPWPGDVRLPLLLTLGCALGLGLLLLVARPARSAVSAGGLGLLIGLGSSACAHEAAFRARLDGAGADAVTLLVRILTVPERSLAPGQVPAARFQVRVIEQPGLRADISGGAVIRLTWYAAPDVRRGELWRLHARVKGPWSFANPGGFDYERWLLGKGIHGTGWVRDGERLAGAAPDALERLRQRVADAIRRLQPTHAGILLALLLGRADTMDDALWETLRTTGTVHLMVISGLHVSLATALGFAVGGLLCRLCPLLPLWLDARRAGCAVGALVAAAYIALAGAGLPALRALVMGLAVLLLLAGGRRCQPGGLLCLALLLVLAYEPLAVHQQGFWLSFAAVGLLLLTLARHGRSGPVMVALRTQLVLSVGMLPGLALLTGTVPWTGIAANALAVPMMSLAVVPMVLLAGILLLAAPTPAGFLIGVVDCVLSALVSWLEWLAALPQPVVVATGSALLVAQAAALWWLLGAPRQHWPVLLLCLAAPLTPRTTGVAHGEYRVTALDVGQGTAVLVDTQYHRLLYDAGPAFPSGFETGSAVVIPGLGATGPLALSALVLSHDDVDHVGGAAAVRAALAPSVVVQGMPGDSADTAPSVGVGCHGRSWTWDGVNFRFLDVVRGPRATDNDRSCVLLVDDGRRHALLAGDVSARIEGRLLRPLAEIAPLALMFAPHHGSNSSSSTALVRVARPRLVFVSAGRGNRFGHPHPDVVSRYRRLGARIYQTGVDGALVWRSSAPAAVLRWRRDRAPYWRASPPAER